MDYFLIVAFLYFLTMVGYTLLSCLFNLFRTLFVSLFTLVLTGYCVLFYEWGNHWSFYVSFDVLSPTREEDPINVQIIPYNFRFSGKTRFPYRKHITVKNRTQFDHVFYKTRPTGNEKFRVVRSL